MKVILTGDVCFKEIQSKIDFDSSEKILSEVKPILQNADYRIMNLETPMLKSDVPKPINKSGPNIHAIEKNVGFLNAAKCDCVTLANNHIGDFGEKGVFETVEILNKNNISYVGAGQNLSEAYKAKRVEINNLSVSFISVCENEFGGATDDTAGPAAYDIGLLTESIETEKHVSDFIVVIFHGGNEFNPFPQPGAVNRYRLFCDLGADAVIAMHTHCPQGIETYKGKPIAYSLGNFYFYSSAERKSSSTWYLGYMVELAFRKNENIKMNIIPYSFNKECTLISVLKGEQKRRFNEYFEQLSDPISDPERLKELFNGWCMIQGYYINAFSAYSEEYWSGVKNQALYGIENLLNCESHRDMLARVLKLMCDGKLKEAERFRDYVLKMQELDI